MTTKPESLEQKEITDAITALQNSKTAQGTCGIHVDVVNASILQLRIGEALLYKVDSLCDKEEDSNLLWLGSLKTKRGQVTGLAAIALIVGITVCVLKWGPPLVKVFSSSDPVKLERTAAK